MASALHWAPEVFSSYYDQIQAENAISNECLATLKPDLSSVLVVPKRNEKSRAALAQGESGKPVTLHDGEEYKLNGSFVQSANALSVELNLDELCAAELLQEALNTTFAQGASAVDAGILIFLQRYTYILNILGFAVKSNKLHALMGDNPAKALLPQLLASFEQVYALVAIQNDLIDKQKVTDDINNLQFVQKVVFVKKQLFDIHELLAQVLFEVIDGDIKTLGTYDVYNTLITHINKSISNDADVLLLHYLPALMNLTTQLSDINDKEVQKFHQSFTSSLSADYSKVKSGEEIDASKSSLRPYMLLMQLMFFTSFVPWCKANKQRTQTYDFERDIVKYIEWLINYGTFEQLLSFAAETAEHETQVYLEQNKLFEFRPLLQRSLPRLKPFNFIYAGNEELSKACKLKPSFENAPKLCDYSSLQVSPHLCESLIAPFFHGFFSTFINHAAIILTSLRDEEEDFMLSSINRKQLEADSEKTSNESNAFFDSKSNLKFASASAAAKENDSEEEYGIDLDEIASRAELEKFYLAFAYTYAHRAELCDSIWSSENPNLNGFINWGLANNTSPLISATFCLLLGSLAYGSDTASIKVWESLTLSQTPMPKKNDYTIISIDSIVSSLAYYIDMLTESLDAGLSTQARKIHEKQETMFSSAKFASTTEDEPLLIQLSEDSVAFIAGFMTLISNIVENLKSDLPAAINAKKSLFARFNPIMISFLKFDNLITSAKLSQADNRFTVVQFNDENRTAIVNLVLNLFTKFADGETCALTKNKIWVTIDKWICHSLSDTDASNTQYSEASRYAGFSLTNSVSTKSELSKLKKVCKGIKMKQGFQMALTSISEVSNFVKLLKKLLVTPQTSEKEDELFMLSYPSDLGAEYRYRQQIGIWPYMEYLVTEIFGKSGEIVDKASKVELQKSILEILVSSLKEIDWNLLENDAPAILRDFSKFKDSFANSLSTSGNQSVLSYDNLIRMHHSIAIINYLFDEGASNTLFSIFDYGLDGVSESSNIEELVSLALETLDQTLSLQHPFIARFVKVLKSSEDNTAFQSQSNAIGYGTSMSLLLTTQKSQIENIYYPESLGTKGVSSFYEILLFHTSSIAHIALYAGLSDSKLTKTAIKILGQISHSPIFAGRSPSSKENLFHRSKLLSIFESVDESERIKFSFVQQFEDLSQDMPTKYELLRYLISILEADNGVNIAHFLLGYRIRANGMFLVLSDKTTLIHSLLNVLVSALQMLCQVELSQGINHHVGSEPAMLISLILEIFVRLCQNPISSDMSLTIFRQFGLFKLLVDKQPKFDEMTIWHRERFNGDLSDQTQNGFVEDSESRETFFSLIRFRNSALQYLSLEFHAVASSITKEEYTSLLLDGSQFLDGTPKVLDFLDVLNFQSQNLETYSVMKYEPKFILEDLFVKLRQDLWPSTDTKGQILSDLTDLRCKVANNNLVTQEAKATFRKDAELDLEGLRLGAQKILFAEQLKHLHSKSLHSWAQMIQVITQDGLANKRKFILQVLQVILPKINDDYYERDIMYAEELISLCVFLFDLFMDGDCHPDQAAASTGSELDGLLPLFKTCVNGLLCSNTTITLRSDLYLLLNQFIQQSIGSKDSLKEISMILKSVDTKVIDVVCNDSIYSEGVARITSLVLMESLVNLFSAHDSSVMLNALTKNNSLSLLSRSLKRADEIIEACGEHSDKNWGISVETLIYELTALKTTLYLLIRVGQTRMGATQLMQNDIFAIIKRLKFLRSDAELGFDFHIYTADEGRIKDTTLKLALDVPMTFRAQGQGRADNKSQLQSISFYDVIIPVFQLISTILLSMGPSYRPGLVQVEELMKEVHPFVVGVMKRDSMMEKASAESERKDEPSHSIVGLMQIARLLTLIKTVVSASKTIEE